MPKRISVDIEDFEADLERLADLNYRKVAQEARRILEQGVKAEIAALEESVDESPSGDFLRALARKKPLRNGELVKLAHQLDVPAEILATIRDCYMRETENAKNA